MADLNSIKFLNLPIGEYAIVGSSFLTIRGIREANDIDILVKQNLRKLLLKKYPNKVVTIRPNSNDGDQAIRFEDKGIEITNKWIHLYGKENDIIDSVDIIDGLPFINSKYFKERKSKMGRKKDIKDLKLLKEYEKNQIY